MLEEGPCSHITLLKPQVGHHQLRGGCSNQQWELQAGSRGAGWALLLCSPLKAQTQERGQPLLKGGLIQPLRTGRTVAENHPGRIHFLISLLLSLPILPHSSQTTTNREK